MTMTENPIELVNITEELTRMWNAEQGEKKTRASLFNLILYVQKSERLPFYESLLKSVVSKFPCRVHMIVCDPTSPKEYLRTQVSSETITQGELQIFCEIIRIEAAGSLSERVPFILIPQLLPDLPVYLLWTEDPGAKNPLLSQLEPLTNRTIFDSESTHDLQTYASSVLALVKKFRCAIGDLNWSALSGWRHIFRQTFDTYDAFLNLVQARTIRIHYNKTLAAHTEIEAAYMQAWLASRLNWKFRTLEIHEGNIRLTYHRLANEVSIHLVPKEVPELNSGALLMIEIESEKNKAHYVFKRHPKTRQVFVQFSDKERCDLPTCSYLPGMTEGQEIIEEIFYPQTGAHYREMLEILTATPWSR